MYKWIGLAALLFATGCTNQNAATDKPLTTNQAQTAMPVPKQASSISTNTDSSSIRIKEAPNGAGGLLDWFTGRSGNALTGRSGIPNANPGVSPGANPNANLNANPNVNLDTNPAASPVVSPAASSSQSAQQVLGLVNEERSKAGLQPLTMNGDLASVAMAKAQDMYNHQYFDHQSPTYGSPFDMMKARGITFSSAGENIAKGQTSPAEVMQQWMNSPGHRANILNGGFTQIGIANYNDEWVQEFIG